MVRARLVHEGAVLAGPHGRGHGVRRAPHGAVFLQSRERDTHRACGREPGAVLGSHPTLQPRSPALPHPCKRSGLDGAWSILVWWNTAGSGMSFKIPNYSRIP